MSPKPATDREVRSGFLLGLGCVIALVVGALAFFGRPSAAIARPGEVARTAGAKIIRTPTGQPVRSSAKLVLAEADNILPDAPELGDRALEVLAEARLEELKALARELGCVDETRLFGISKAAEDVLEGMLREPKWQELDQAMTAWSARWAKADAAERLHLHASVNAAYDALLAEVRRRWAALR